MEPVFISYKYLPIVGESAVESRIIAVSNKPGNGAVNGTTPVELMETVSGLQHRAGRHVPGVNET